MNREYLNFAQNQPNVMSDEKTLTVDLEKVIRDKNPALARLLPRFVVAYLKRTIHQDEINRILQAYSHLEPIPFIRAALADMGIRYRAVGLEKLPREGRYLFASNHPFGGMDGMMLCDELERHFGSVKIIVNDLLMHLTPLNPLFIPVNKHGRQNARYAQTLRDTLESNAQIATFPAGLCSRRHHGRVADPRWKHSFVKNALESRRDIVPVRFDGELSSFFYNLSNLSSALGIRANIEMLYLADEMFRQKGRHFDIRFGEPVRWQSLRDAPAKVWAGRIRDMVYGLGSE